jgi:hypothetical protein
MTKRLMGTVMATVFAIASASAIAEAPLSKAVQMTDAQLDQVTAAGAIVGHVIHNAGNDHPLVTRGDPSNPTFLKCVNCAELGGSLELGPAQGVHLIINRGHPLGKLKCFGGFPGC